MKIICPNCKKSLEVSEALKHQIEEDVKAALSEENKENLVKLKKELEEKQTNELLDLKSQIEKKDEKLAEFKEYEIKLREEKREIEQKRKDLELEVERKIDEERKKIEDKTLKEEEEKYRLKDKEKEKIIEDLKQALKDAERKASLGSQQLQGEVMELDLEDQLIKSFIYDQFNPIPKGVEGADIWQIVRNKHGQEAGSILWETKRTKSWSNSWLSKLREDTRKINASICILVSDSLPNGIKYYDRADGVWICSYSHTISLAKVLREGLLQVAIAKSSASHKDEKLAEIYEYITSEAFRHKIEAHFESVKVLKEDLDMEKRAMERIWKKREVQIQRLDKSMSQMFGEIQGIAGPMLPTLKNLELKAGEDSGQEEIF